MGSHSEEGTLLSEVGPCDVLLGRGKAKRSYTTVRRDLTIGMV
jgi:hypothetical protein